jgi:hypothetical protein
MRSMGLAELITMESQVALPHNLAGLLLVMDYT